MKIEQVKHIINDCLSELYKNSEPSTDIKDIKKAFERNDVSVLVNRSCIPEERFLLISNKHRKMIPSRYFNTFRQQVMMYRPFIINKRGEKY